MKLLVTQLCLTLCDPINCSLPRLFLSMEVSRQEYWSGLLSPGDFPNPGIEPASPVLQADSLLSEPPGFYIKFACN